MKPKAPSPAQAEEIADLDQRIAVIRDNLRELVEQAAAYSGAADEVAPPIASPTRRRSSPRS